jgi:hypothetical protein
MNFSNFKYRFILPISTALVIFFIIFYSIEKIGGNENIWIEAEDAGIITKGFEITEDVNASKGKVISNLLPSHQSGAFVSYEFTINKTGKYFVWLRTLWAGGCSNTFKISVDKSDKVFIGNDNIFHQWHWIQQTPYEFKKGKHVLTIYNEESDTKLDKLLITSNPYNIPSGIGISSDFQINFNEGIPNFMRMEAVESNEIKFDNEANSLFIKALNSPNGSTIIIDKENSNVFDLKFVLQPDYKDVKQKIGILFNVQDKNNYEKFEIGHHSIKHICIRGNMEKIQKSTSSEEDYLMDKYETLDLQYNDPEIKLRINEKTIIESSVKEHHNGKIGLWVNHGNLKLRNIVNATDLIPNYFENFFWALKYDLLNGKNNNVKWEIISGNLHSESANRAMVMTIGGQNISKQPFIAVFGNNYWKNYSIEAAVQLAAGEAGVFFNFIDINNYYLLKVNGEKRMLTLYKANNHLSKLAEKVYDLKYSEWYKVKASKYNDSIYIQIDDSLLIKTVDKSFQEGKAGIFSNSLSEENKFDDISVRKFTPQSLNKVEKKILEYHFEMRDKSGIDLCDWENSANIFIGRAQDADGYLVNKQVFLPAVMDNKKTYKGDFKVSWKTSEVPVDIDIMASFEIKDGSLKDHYNFIFASDQINIVKNNKQIFADTFNNLARNELGIEFVKNKWYIKSRGIIVLKLSDILKVDEVKIKYGFIGIGTNKIEIQKIMIEDNLGTN